ncbi:hypothetical protein BN2497_5821 [Janthinobacterium sp. CG23_2]|nr:hypothetical protein BN2497_5821 [Janthinobacterium sp. CG23_2]CUU29308.1 hypothetical protein BN3177_5821 [Janthinobacterium sp. CG23_2]
MVTGVWLPPHLGRLQAPKGSAAGRSHVKAACLAPAHPLVTIFCYYIPIFHLYCLRGQFAGQSKAG